MKKNAFILSLTILLFLTFLPLTAQNQERLKTQPLPTFAENKPQLPIPVIEDEPGWIEMYWFCWKEAFKHLKKPLPASPFVANYVDEAFAPQIFQWDTHFMIQFWKYAYYIFPAIESQDNFYVCQDSDGYICREIHEDDGSFYFFRGKANTINPPLFAWVEYSYYKMSGDTSRFRRVIPILEKYMGWIEKNRKYATRHHLYWQTNLGSGMDNCPRTGTGWVDISAQMAMSYESLAKMSRIIDEKEQSRRFHRKYQEIKQAMNHWMWNEKDGLYYDVYDFGEQLPVKSVACFWPMLARIPSQKQAEKMVVNLQDTASFWRLIPFPSLAANHPAYRPKDGYWLGSVWAPTNYMIIRGLGNYGFYDLAYRASVRYLRGMEAVYKKTGTVWENYNPDAFVKSERAKPDFVGWTGLGPIAVLIETIIGIQADAPNNTIQWHLHRTDRHGIKNLHVGKAVVSLVAQPRKSLQAKVKIMIKTNRSITLRLIEAGKEKAFKMAAGKSIILF